MYVPESDTRPLLAKQYPHPPGQSPFGTIHVSAKHNYTVLQVVTGEVVPAINVYVALSRAVHRLQYISLNSSEQSKLQHQELY